VVTLVYLTIQVRHSKEAMEANTRAMEEGRKLAMAQAYQARATDTERGLHMAADSTYIPPIFVKYQERGRDALTAEEEFRLTRAHQALRTQADNMHYQYEMGFLDRAYYESSAVRFLRNSATAWSDLGLLEGMRPSFRAEVDRVLAEAETES
jgi:hypothetical protein